MRLPFVSRASHEALCVSERARAVQAECALAALQGRFDALVDRVLTVPEKAVTKPQTTDPVWEAIRLRAGANRPLREHLGRYAMAERAKQRANSGLDDTALVGAITDWPVVDDDRGVDG